MGIGALTFELFSSSFCGACHHTRTNLERALAYLPGAAIVEHDIAREPELAETLDIDATPTVILRTADGAEAMRATGVPSIEHILTAATRFVTPDDGSARVPDERVDLVRAQAEHSHPPDRE